VLRDVVGSFLDSVTEREFDGPLLALLGHLGYDDIHFTHGAFEFGKDVVAKRGSGPGRRQYAIQSKAGDIGLNDWREVRPQMEEAAWNDLAHPNFSKGMPRVAVLVMTGVLKGGAILEAQNLATKHMDRDGTLIEVWDRSQLLDWFAQSPELGLAGAGTAFNALVSNIDLGKVTERDLERYARTWLPDADESVSQNTGRRALEAAVLGNRLRVTNRLDLAAMLALHLFRAAWTTAGLSEPRSHAAYSALRLFGGYASELLDEVSPLASDPNDLARRVISPYAIVTYNVVCSRILEIVSLLALVAQEMPGVADSVAVQAAEVSVLLATLHPGCSRAVSDDFAAGILAPAVVLSRHAPEQLQSFLRRHGRWLLDSYDEEKAGLGLCAIDDDEEATYERLLGGPLESTKLEWRANSFLATVLMDLSALSGLDSLYEALVDNVAALRIVPAIVAADETLAHFRRGGARVWPHPRLDYAPALTTEAWPSTHHANDAIGMLPDLDALLLASSTRSRYSVAALRNLLARRANS
jgi:hypothetical protein